MASTLAPQPILRQRLSLCSSRSPFSLLFIRHAHKKTHSDVPGYHKIRFRRLEKKRILLWDEKKGSLRNFSVLQVMRDFLGPGKALSWLPEHELLKRMSKSPSAAAQDDNGENPFAFLLPYEIMSISESILKLSTNLRRNERDKAEHQVSFRADLPLASSPPQFHLAHAYRLLGDPEDGARHPVRFRIAPYYGESSSRPYSIKWAVENRVDLHPKVIMRAMPDGVHYTTKPHMRRDGNEVFWCLAAKHYDPGLTAKPRSEWQGGFDRALKAAVQRKKAVIQKICERDLEKRVNRRLKKLNGGHPGPLPEEKSKMKEQMRNYLEQAMPKIRKEVARKLGIDLKLWTNAVENDPVDDSEGAAPSPAPETKSS